jgi:hypothetical protein
MNAKPTCDGAMGMLFPVLDLAVNQGILICVVFLCAFRGMRKGSLTFCAGLIASSFSITKNCAKSTWNALLANWIYTLLVLLMPVLLTVASTCFRELLFVLAFHCLSHLYKCIARQSFGRDFSLPAMPDGWSDDPEEAIPFAHLLRERKCASAVLEDVLLDDAKQSALEGSIPLDQGTGKDSQIFGYEVQDDGNQSALEGSIQLYQDTGEDSHDTSAVPASLTGTTRTTGLSVSSSKLLASNCHHEGKGSLPDNSCRSISAEVSRPSPELTAANFRASEGCLARTCETSFRTDSEERTEAEVTEPEGLPVPASAAPECVVAN